MAAMNRRLLALRLLGLGWYVAICIVVGAAGGLALDRWLNLAPLFTLSGVLLGTVAAFYGLFKLIRPLLASAPAPEAGAPDARHSAAGSPLSGAQSCSGDASCCGGANGETR